MKSYDLFDLFAAWFTWMAKPRRILTGKLQDAGWEPTPGEKEGKNREVLHARGMSYTEYRTEW